MTNQKTEKEAVLHCFTCMEPIEPAIEFETYRPIRVKESFCHESYWQTDKGKQYGELDNNGFGVLYECIKCNPDGEIWESYDYCEICNCMVHESDVSYKALEEFGEVMCKECYLKEKGFDTEQIYVKTDAWRGIGSTKPANPNIAIAAECCFVPHDQNDKILEIVYEWLKQHGYEYIRTTHRTSNVFSVNVQILAKKDRPLTDQELESLKQLDDIFVDYYTRGFSIMSGKTYPIDLEAFKYKLSQIPIPKHNIRMREET